MEKSCGTCKFYNSELGICTSQHPLWGGKETKSYEERICGNYTIKKQEIKKNCKNCSNCYLKTVQGFNKEATRFCLSRSGSIMAGQDLDEKFMEEGSVGCSSWQPTKK